MKAHNFLQWIEYAGLSAREIAEGLGVSRQTVYCWIQGKHAPTLAHLIAMGKLSKEPVDPAWFLSSQEPTK